MSIGLIGRKCGMTRVFCEDGSSVPLLFSRLTQTELLRLKVLTLMVIDQSR